jgi:hypothetical protein
MPSFSIVLNLSGILYMVFEQWTFFGMGLSALCPTRSYPGGSMFSVRAVSPSWPVPIWSVGNSLFTLTWLSRINVAQEPWHGHACIGLSRNIWLYSSFISMPLSARCTPSRPSYCFGSQCYIPADHSLTFTYMRTLNFTRLNFSHCLPSIVLLSSCRIL